MSEDGLEIEGKCSVEKEAEAVRRFFRERPYWKLLDLAETLEDDIRRSDSRKRAEGLGRIVVGMRAVANELYLARKGLMDPPNVEAG